MVPLPEIPYAFKSRKCLSRKSAWPSSQPPAAFSRKCDPKRSLLVLFHWHFPQAAHVSITCPCCVIQPKTIDWNEFENAQQLSKWQYGPRDAWHGASQL
eukprot:3210610-Amphidinium_carterae.1